MPELRKIPRLLRIIPIRANAIRPEPRHCFLLLTRLRVPRCPLRYYCAILINSVVFLWTLGLSPEMLNVVLVHYALIPLRYTNPAMARSFGLNPDNFLPLITDAFLHGGWLHIIFNMWFLWIFGPAMEARLGRL